MNPETAPPGLHNDIGESIMKTIMNIRTILAALAVMTASACHDNLPKTDHYFSDEMVSLSVSVPTIKTKVSEKNSPGTPDAINTLQVFVFDEGGILEASDMTESESVVLTCKTGPKKVVSLVNAPEMTDVTTYSALCSASSFLDDNTIDSMVMSGETEVNLTATSSVTIPVSRLAAKVVLRQVMNNFKFKSDQDAEFLVTHVYLLNVGAERGYLSAATPKQWYNMMELDTFDSPAFTYEQLSSPVKLPYSSTWTADKYFYCYPNPTETDSSDETWSARRTRLVLEATLDGEVMYYPVTLPVIEPNSSYEVTVKITRRGSPSPDIPVTGIAAEFSVDVQSWIVRDRIEEVI